MSKHNDKIIKIGKSIRNQANIEKNNPGQNVAIARFDVDMVMPNGMPVTHLWIASGNSYSPRHIAHYDIAGNFRGTTGNYIQSKKEPGSEYVNKNSSLGVILTSRPFGTHKYNAPKDSYGKRMEERTITFTSKATYGSGQYVKDLNINILGGESFQSALLDDLLRDIDKIDKELELKKQEQKRKEEELRKLEEERKQREEEIKKAEEAEAERLRIEQEKTIAKQKEEEELRKKEELEIQMLEDAKNRASDLLKQTNASFRSGREMRYQEIVDESQTLAKISHLYDGVPIVIDGGPGTGKTTTSIQRLKFLIDPYLKEHEGCKISQNQIDTLTDPLTISSHWIFISPSDLLAQYLKSALSAEGLANGTNNVTPFENFLIARLQEYNITTSTNKNKPLFKPIRSTNALSAKVLIKDGKSAVESFEQFIIQQLSKSFANAIAIDTTSFSWKYCAERIKKLCMDIEKVRSLMDLIKLYDKIQINEQENVREYNKALTDLLGLCAYRIRKKIMSDEETVNYLAILFDDWSKSNNEVEIEDIEDAEESENIIDIKDINEKVFHQLKSTLRRLGLRKYDKSIDLTKRQKEFYDWVKDFIEDSDINEISELAWFNKSFSTLCRGFESNVINQILKLYKIFRREQVKNQSSSFDIEVLKEVISKNENRQLHHDEQVLLLGYINNLMRNIHNWSNLKFEAVKHKFADAYKHAIKYVIGVDEASDYSELDYYCLSSFAHYDFSAITLCGDIMQGLGNNGISSWESLKKWVFPKLEIYPLKKSYRQWPTLLDLSKQMYEDDLGMKAPFESALVKQEYEAVPLAFISEDEDEKIDWLANRIDEVYNHFGALPSIAIFLNENEKCDEFLEKIREHDNMAKFFIEDCTHGNQGREDSIRIFHLSSVKGMEFEAAFFHNIDSSNIENDQLLRRYLYVGISRAVSHLGATFKTKHSEILKYFELNKDWS